VLKNQRLVGLKNQRFWGLKDRILVDRTNQNFVHEKGSFVSEGSKNTLSMQSQSGGSGRLHIVEIFSRSFSLNNF